MTKFGQQGVIHLRRHSQRVLVLHMTAAADLEVGMERGWLTLQESCVVGVAGNTKSRLDAFYRSVTGRAILR